MTASSTPDPRRLDAVCTRRRSGVLAQRARTVGSGLALIAGLLIASLLGACAARVDVRGIGSGGAPPFYELRGHRAEALANQARLLCPTGYRTARSWQRQAPAEAGNGPIAYARNVVDDTLWPGLDDQAQLVIQCNGGVPLFEPIGLPAPAAPASPATPPALSRRIDVTEPKAVSVPEAVTPQAALPGSAPAVPPLKGGAAGKPPPAKSGTKSPFNVPATGAAGRGSM